MDENPLTTTVLEPFRLVMRRAICHYCGSEEYNDIYISDLVGIRHCPDHKAWAQRDCNAYLHIKRIVPMHDVGKHPALQELTELLTKNTVHVRRTSGTLDPCWILRGPNEYKFVIDFIIHSDGEWVFPMKHQTDGIQKHVSLKSLLCEENSGILTKELVDQVLDVLDKGLYTQDFLDQEACSAKITDSKEPEELPNIHTVLIEGQECRIFLDPSLR